MRGSALFLLTILCTLPGLAQERLDTLEIRGTKEGNTSAASTESVTVLREDGVAGTGSEEPLQILNGVPNVQVNKSGESFSIRGISSAGVTGYQKDNLASILVDDIFQTDLSLAAGGFDLWDMERIEVLRGTQSTHQGVNSLAGLILLFHNEPAPENSGALRGGLGSFNQREGAFLSNNRWNDRVFSRLSYEKETNDGFIKNIATGNPRWGMKDREAASLGVLVRISDGETLRLTTRYLRNDQGGTYVQSPNPFEALVNEDVDARATTDSRQVALQHVKKISDTLSNRLTLTSSASAQVARSDADGTSAASAGTRHEDHKDRYVSLENLLISEHGPLRNRFGLHAHDFRLDDDYDFILLYPLNSTTSTPVHVDQTVERSRTVASVFDSIRYRLTERTAVDAGLRFEFVTNKYGTDVDPRRLQNLGTGTNAAIDAKLAQYRGAYDDRKSQSILLPKIGLLHDIGDHHLGATYARGYRTGGLSINRTRAEAVAYDPEFTDNYELSYKFSQADVEFGANLFYVDWSAQQVQVHLSNDFYDTQVENAARSQLYGAEVQIQLKNDIDAWAFGAGHVRTSFKDFVNGTTDYHGNEFPFAARWTGRLSYWRRWTESLSSTALLRYVGPSFANAENDRTSAEQVTVDLNAQAPWKDVVFEAYVRNLFDRRSLIYDGRPKNMTTDYQSVYSQINPPRELGGRISYYW